MIQDILDKISLMWCICLYENKNILAVKIEPRILILKIGPIFLEIFNISKILFSAHIHPMEKPLNNRSFHFTPRFHLEFRDLRFI